MHNEKILLAILITSTDMIQSMTGFGRGNASSPTKNIIVEIKSLNSKQLDLSMRAPSYFRELEVTMRNTLAQKLIRGKIDLAVTVENLTDEISASINPDVMARYKTQLETVGRELGIGVPQDWFATLLRLPDTLKTELRSVDEEDENAFREACLKAVDNLLDFRSTEGAKLYSFFTQKIGSIGRLLEETESYEESRVPKIRARLEEQLSRLESIEYDKGRLEQELIFYIEKLDVTEEKTRLRAHLKYFMDTLNLPVGSGQGKKLGFIAQEMGREINTLGSKANNAELQIIVVKMKDELEQIKEQVLNVL